MVSFETKPYSKKLLHLISWGHWFTFFNIIAAIVLSSVYLINEASPETFTGYLYLGTTWLSHMAFLTFITFVLTVFPLTLLFPRTRFIRAFASITFTVVLLLLLLDAFVYNRLGYHINASSAGQIIQLISAEISEDRRTFWFITIILTLFILTFELVASNYAWKHLKQLQKTVFPKFVVFGFVTCFFASHLMHIWADANLEYDVLKQDTILPLSYPTTAKTLLTKYGLFNKTDYLERKTSPLSFNDPMPIYPTIGQCSAEQLSQKTYIVLTKAMLTDEQISQFQQRSSTSTILLSHHVDNAQPENAWFNLFYGLPTIYQSAIKENNASSVLFQALKNNELASSFTTIGNGSKNESIAWLTENFDKQQQVENISPLIFDRSLSKLPSGLHVFYFDSDTNYEVELFIDALLLSQKLKPQKDNIIITSVGNQNLNTRLAIKPTLLVWPHNKTKQIDKLTSHMDIVPTLLKEWLACDDVAHLSAGKSLLGLNEDRVIANTVDQGIVVFNKDKSVFIDQNGNFQSYSRQLAAPITVSSDFPLMIDGVHFIKQFSQNNQSVQ
ncbi:DUF3413 domain-containing protein [Thalassotalea euphylliae]|uniref:DUF3413 domain-containing protein n=1 Tax=Thalassotalea euphylliae TaxID=1655234 RepID=UPI00362B7CC8